MSQVPQEAAAHRFGSLVLSLEHSWVWREGKSAHYAILLVALSMALLI